MKNYIYFKIILILSFFISETVSASIKSCPVKKHNPNSTADAAPIISATGNQIYCPQTNLKIVTDISIIDPDPTETPIDAIYIQISSGYVNGEDQLTLTGNHPLITSSWNVLTGKLKLFNPTGTLVPYTAFIAAIKEVEFYTESITPSENRNFSISIGQANYLPSTQHYYQYVPNSGITWTDAKVAAEASTYYGLQGYLATISALDEAQLIGKQASGTGWIGGSDAETEGVWKWVTGPEKGTVFWNGLSDGSTPNFAFWNTNEPNQRGNEDYAHVTAPGIGVLGSWNDISNTGDPSGNYQAKGYVVEYGGMPNDPEIHVATSTSITIPQITKTTDASRCGAGNLTLEAKSNLGIINWYETENSGTTIATGTTFTTPEITKTTTYYVETKYPLCSKIIKRTAVTATIINIPIITSQTSKYSLCGEGNITLTASTSDGTIYWYSEPTGNSLIAVGNSLTRFITTNTNFYVEAVNQNCTTGKRILIEVVVYDLPIIENQKIIKCKEEKVTLTASLFGVNYLWSNRKTTPTIEIDTPDTYTVAITKPEPENCIITETFIVTEYSAPKIKNVLVEEDIVSIDLETSANYFEYSIDNINFQDSNVFQNVTSGIHTATVRDVKMCGLDSQDFIVIITPKYFTPNNDSFNDFWKIKGIENYPEATVTVFDRYGKLITVLNSLNPTWDGTFNGIPLPSSDYWYHLKLDETKPEMRGHFTLKR